jgi:3-oxoacyl-[acyl-carrier-protein] synthase II
MDPARRRVVITGMGAVCALGMEIDEIWSAIVAGRSGAGPIRQFPSQSFPVRIGSEVDASAIPLRDVNGLRKYLSRSALFGLWAMDRAWQDARLDGCDLNRWRAGVCIGASTFPVVEGSLPDPRKLIAGDHYNADEYLSLCREHPELLAQRDMPSVSTVLSLRRNLRGPSITVQSACTSATQAIGESFEMIRRGKVDLLITGGADSMMSVVCVAGFTLLGALTRQNEHPHKASRPFDLKRDGFLIGEGAGLVILEELQHALRRKAPIHAEVIGYGSSSDGYRFTDVDPQGLGPAKCMSAALSNAGVKPADVDYINAHGTSTPQNDRVETLAIKHIFHDHAYRVLVSSTKSQLGHLVCAAGGIEVILTTLALQTQIAPPTINLDHPDPDCDLDYVPHEPRHTPMNIAISNSFGFGGQNGTVVLKRWTSPDEFNKGDKRLKVEVESGPAKASDFAFNGGRLQ